jgi:hypothetical protein
MHKYFLLFLCLYLPIQLPAQVLGGKSVFSFLDLPFSPQLTALGGINISHIQNDVPHAQNDVSLATVNPALLRPAMDQQVQMNYTSYFASIQYAQCIFAYQLKNTSLAANVQYIDYGTLTQTDAAGTVQGTFQPKDMSAQITASWQYLERWHYGISLQWVQSRYQQYRASGLAFHFGLTYSDTAHNWQAGLVARNMGTQLHTYTPGDNEPLPFDLQLGISKKIEHLQLSATLHHVYQFDTRYADPAFQEGTLITNGDTARAGGQTIDKIFRHFVLAAQLEVGHYVQVTAGYNHLRRQELADPLQKGLSGFSLGVGVITRKIQIRYAASWYQRSAALNQIGVSVPIKEWNN